MPCVVVGEYVGAELKEIRINEKCGYANKILFGVPWDEGFERITKK